MIRVHQHIVRKDIYKYKLLGTFDSQKVIEDSLCQRYNLRDTNVYKMKIKIEMHTLEIEN